MANQKLSLSDPTYNPKAATTTTAPVSTTTTPTLSRPEIASQLNTISQELNRRKLSGISSPAPAPASVTAPQLPTPIAPAVQDSFFNSLTSQVNTTRSTLESAYKQQLADNQKQIEESRKEMDRLREEQLSTIETDVEPLLTPFREELENKERERLYINENFEANQALTRELETLLTEGNEFIRARKDQAIPLSILNRQVNKTIEDVTARAGVIQAVMSARSGQIAEGYRLIDRSINAIAADRQDKLSYYQTILEFYETQRTEEGERLINLEADQKEFLKAEIALLENDLVQAQDNANYIKNLMITPESALFMANAGVTLTDTPEVVAQKMAAQAQRDEIQNFKNELVAKGYEFVPYGSGNVSFNVGGQTLSFREPPTISSGGGGGLNINQITDNERALFGQFRGEPIVKDYNSMLQKKLSVESIVKSGVGGPGDLALVFEFMKALDPTSVVREAEYETAAKSGNIFAGAFARFNGYLKENGGFLPPNVQQAFLSLADSKFQVQTQLYNNLANEYRSVAERQGLDPNNVVLGYDNAAPQDFTTDQKTAALDELLGQPDIPDVEEQPDGWFDKFLGVFGLKTK